MGTLRPISIYLLYGYMEFWVTCQVALFGPKAPCPQTIEVPEALKPASLKSVRTRAENLLALVVKSFIERS